MLWFWGCCRTTSSRRLSRVPVGSAIMRSADSSRLRWIFENYGDNYETSETFSMTIQMVECNRVISWQYYYYYYHSVRYPIPSALTISGFAAVIIRLCSLSRKFLFQEVKTRPECWLVILSCFKLVNYYHTVLKSQFLRFRNFLFLVTELKPGWN